MSLPGSVAQPDNSDIIGEWDLQNSLKDTTGTGALALTNCASGTPTSIGGNTGGYSFLASSSQCFVLPAAADHGNTLEWWSDFTPPGFTPGTFTVWSPLAQNGNGSLNSGTHINFQNGNVNYQTQTSFTTIIAAFNGGAGTLNSMASPAGRHFYVEVRGVNGCVATPTCAFDVLYIDGKTWPVQFLGTQSIRSTPTQSH